MPPRIHCSLDVHSGCENCWASGGTWNWWHTPIPIPWYKQKYFQTSTLPPVCLCSVNFKQNMQFSKWNTEPCPKLEDSARGMISLGKGYFWDSFEDTLSPIFVSSQDLKRRAAPTWDSVLWKRKLQLTVSYVWQLNTSRYICSDCMNYLMHLWASMLPTVASNLSPLEDSAWKFSGTASKTSQSCGFDGNVTANGTLATIRGVESSMFLIHMQDEETQSCGLSRILMKSLIHQISLWLFQIIGMISCLSKMTRQANMAFD